MDFLRFDREWQNALLGLWVRKGGGELDVRIGALWLGVAAALILRAAGV